MSFIDTIKNYAPGLLVVAIIATAAYFLNEAIEAVVPLEAVTIAIILGMLAANTLRLPVATRQGVRFSAHTLLQAGIVLLGFKLDFSAVAHLGVKTLLLIVVFTPTAIALAWLLGRVFRIGGKSPLLVGVGSGICGASAIVALAPVVKAKDEETVVAVSIVNFLGAIGVLAYSFIASQHILDVSQYGVWSGISLQGVAHALAAGFAGGDAAGELGTIVKMGRVLMLAPVALFFSLRYRDVEEAKVSVKFPWYVLLFVLCGGVNSLHLAPVALTALLAKLSGWLILLAMTGMGLSVQLAAIRRGGAKAAAMSGLLFAIIALTTFFLIRMWY